METNTQHPLSQAFIQQASVIIGHRQEIRGVHPLNQNDIQRECEKIRAVSPRILQADLDGQEGSYFFKYRLQGQSFQIHCEAADTPAVALYYGVKALKDDGINYLLSFPKPAIKDFRPSPLTQDQEVSARRELGGLFINFKVDVDEALASSFQIDSQLNFLEAILNDLESVEWSDEVAGGILANRVIVEAQEWVEGKYDFTFQDIGTLSEDEKQSRSAVVPVTQIRPITKSPENDPEMRKFQRRVALLYAYSPNTIEKKNEIAKRYGWASGSESLYKHYTRMSQKTNRVNAVDIRKMISDIEAVLPYLGGHHLKDAQDNQRELYSKIVTGRDR